MKIDWKSLAKTKGYKSLKSAMIYDIVNRRRTRKEAYALFNWVISRAKHYSHIQGRYIGNVLDFWEENRSYWWVNYYKNANQPKLSVSPNVKPQGLKGAIKYYKTDRWYVNDRKLGTKLLMKHIRVSAVKNRTKKAKWSSERKKRGY